MHLSDFRGWLQGEDVVVVGGGPSALGYPDGEAGFVDAPEDDLPSWTIACNRAAMALTPDFLVCFEQEDDPIWDELARHTATVAFVNHAKLPRSVAVTLFPHGSWRKHLYALNSWQMSPLTAVDLARHMGAKRVGLIGVDLAGHKLWGKPSGIELANDVWASYHAWLQEQGVELVNLSPKSLLHSVPQGDWKDIRTKGERWHSSNSKAARPSGQ